METLSLLREEAVYFSAAMMSTSGGGVVSALNPHWKLMGALEAIGGKLLFGLSAAFLFVAHKEPGHFHCVLKSRVIGNIDPENEYRRAQLGRFSASPHLPRNVDSV